MIDKYDRKLTRDFLRKRYGGNKYLRIAFHKGHDAVIDEISKDIEKKKNNRKRNNDRT